MSNETEKKQYYRNPKLATLTFIVRPHNQTLQQIANTSRDSIRWVGSLIGIYLSAIVAVTFSPFYLVLVVFVLLVLSMIAGVYEAGKYSAQNAIYYGDIYIKDKVQKAKDVRNVQAIAVFMNFILFALLYFLH